jgi:hypothetical protein
MVAKADPVSLVLATVPCHISPLLCLPEMPRSQKLVGSLLWVPTPQVLEWHQHSGHKGQTHRGLFIRSLTHSLVIRTSSTQFLSTQ